jgi:hypothetical protein
MFSGFKVQNTRHVKYRRSKRKSKRLELFVTFVTLALRLLSGLGAFSFVSSYIMKLWVCIFHS